MITTIEKGPITLRIQQTKKRAIYSFSKYTSQFVRFLGWLANNYIYAQLKDYITISPKYSPTGEISFYFLTVLSKLNITCNEYCTRAAASCAVAKCKSADMKNKMTIT